MTAAAANYFETFFLVFCRTGLVFFSLPGLSGPRYPLNVRLIMALAVSQSITPFVMGGNLLVNLAATHILLNIFSELATGFVIGFWSFTFVYAARFAGTFINSAIGLSGIPGQPIDEQESSNNVAVLLSLGTTALIFATNLHLVSIEGLVRSYQVLPIGQALSLPWSMQRTLAVLQGSFVAGLQCGSPFVVLSIVVNLALGLANKMTPQLSVYFAFSGIVLIASLATLAYLSPKLLMIPVNAYDNFITTGPL